MGVNGRSLVVERTVVLSCVRGQGKERRTLSNIGFNRRRLKRVWDYSPSSNWIDIRTEVKRVVNKFELKVTLKRNYVTK